MVGRETATLPGWLSSYCTLTAIRSHKSNRNFNTNRCIFVAAYPRRRTWHLTRSPEPSLRAGTPLHFLTNGVPAFQRSGTSRILSRSEYDQLRVHTQGSPADTQAPTHWNLISRSMTASPPALSPSSILPPLFISVRFNFCKDISARLSKVLLFPTLSYTFLKIA